MTNTERRIIAVAVSTAPVAMAVALFLVGYSQSHGAWWSAAVELAVLGGITVMIYGVNVQALPAHSGRPWPYAHTVAAQIGTGIIGAWMVAFGYGFSLYYLVRIGHILAFAGAMLFLTNLMLLFVSSGARPPRIPWEERTPSQKADRKAIPFTIISGLVVVLGTGLGILLDYWRPTFGRWDLVWAHLMLLGFFFAMASGTSYHMLDTWAGRNYTSLRLITIQVIGFLIGLPAMTIALGWDIDWLFRIGAISMATAMICWVINISPVAWRLRPAAGLGILLALGFMIVGITLGVVFAFDAAIGAHLRVSHVVGNLFGFAGLLMSGFAYRYIPMFTASDDIRWPQFRLPQLMLMAIACAGGMLILGLYKYGEIGVDSLIWPGILGAVAMLILAANTLGTFMLRVATETDTTGGRSVKANIDDATLIS